MAVDGIFWQLLAYCAGVGSSMLIIGSAAGVVVMGFRLNVPHIEVPTPVSLAVIFGVLLLSMLFSVVVTRNKGTTPNIK